LDTETERKAQKWSEKGEMQRKERGKQEMLKKNVFQAYTERNKREEVF
jgi:hypothetical protein